MVLAVTGPPEGVRYRADDAQGVEQRDVGQVHLDALGGVVGIEEDVDAGGLADGLVDHLGVFGHVQGERLVGEQLQLRRRAHLFDLLLGGGFHGQIVPQLLDRLAVLAADLVDQLLRGLVAGIDLGGVNELGQRALSIPGLEQLAALRDVGCRSRGAHAQQRDAVSEILGIPCGGLLVIRQGGVVVLAGLGLLAALEVGVGRLGVETNAG